MGLTNNSVPVAWQLKRAARVGVQKARGFLTGPLQNTLFRLELRCATPHTEAEIAEMEQGWAWLFEPDPDAPLPTPRPEGPQGFAYNGLVYIRPVGRGVLLEDLGEDGTYLDDVIEDLNGGDGYGHLDVQVTWTPQPNHGREAQTVA